MSRNQGMAIRAVIILGLGVIIALLLPRDSGAHDDAQVKGEVARLTSELEVMKREERETRELAALSMRTAQRQETKDKPASDSAEASAWTHREDRDHGPAPAPAPRTEASFEALHAELESRFAAQPRDDAWSRTAAEQVTQKLTAALPPQSRFLSVDCRQSICRAEIAHTDVDRHREYLQGSIMAPGTWDGPVLAVLEESTGNAGVVTVAYIGKTGTSLFPESIGP